MQPRSMNHHQSLRLPQTPSGFPSLKLLQNSQCIGQSQHYQTGRINAGISDNFLLSQRICCQTSLKAIASPRGATSNMKIDARIEKELIKNKRNTLPAQFTFPKFQDKKVESSPIRQPTRINFSYSRSQPSTPFSSSNNSGGIFSSDESFLNPIKSKKILKIAKNRLCSNQFNISYSPLELFGKRSLQIQKLLDSIKVEAQKLQVKTSTQSKLTSAQTIPSMMLNDGQIRPSSFKLKSGQQQKINRQSNSYQKLSLTDNLPSSKKLGNTIMLPQTAYDFGGLISSQSRQSLSKQEIPMMQNSSNSQQWSQLRGLLTEQSQTDLKESIHCGPDIRATRYNCSMLQKFGRQIEQSILSFQE